jgi:hypothetical protein
MTDLTEQWQKGELPAGWYWCECYKEEIKILYYDRDCFELDDPETKNYYFFLKKDCEEITILAPVPTYSEYLALQSDSLAKNEGVEIVAELEKRLKKTQWLELDLRRKNHELKELLKECREPLEVLAEKRNACDWYPEDLLSKFYQALGEDKCTPL